MVENNTDNHSTAFTVSIDHIDTTTGISAYERSVTAMKCAADDARPEDFRRPGHMFPLLAKKNGVLERTATPKQRWISADLPASRKWDCAAKSCATTAR